MYNSSSGFFVVLFSALLNLVSLTDVTAQQETVLYYDFDDASDGFENAPEVASDGLQSGGWIDRYATLTDFAGNPGRALAGRGFDIDNAFILALSVEPGYVMNLEAFSFDQMASSSGPQRWSLSFNDQLVAEGATSAGFTAVNGLIEPQDWFGEVLIAIAGTQASSDRGTLRLDNFRLAGSVQTVPLPAPLMLLLSGLFTLIRYYR